MPELSGPIAKYNRKLYGLQCIIRPKQSNLFLNFGIGLLANQDRAGQGTIINTHASLLLAYQFHIKKSTLKSRGTGHLFSKLPQPK